MEAGAETRIAATPPRAAEGGEPPATSRFSREALAKELNPSQLEACLPYASSSRRFVED